MTDEPAATPPMVPALADQPIASASVDTGSRGQRWPLVAAVSYVVILVIGLFVAPASPGVGASGARLVLFYQAHAGGVRFITWLSAVSLIPLALLLAHLRSRLHGAARDVNLFGAVGLISSTIVWSWFGAGLALHANTLTPNTARALADVSSYFGPILTVSIVLLIAPIGVAAWHRESGLPRWLAWVTLMFAAEQTIETITIFGRHGFIAPGGPMNFELGATLFLIWILAAGIATAHRPSATT